jgi:hypothetical protein
MFKKTLLATTALTVLSAGVAFSEMKISGKMEYNYIGGDSTAVATDVAKALGSETVLIFKGNGNLGAGGSYALNYEFSNGGQDVVQMDLKFGPTTIEIGQNNSAGVEDVKALLPYVNNRFADIVSTTGISDVQDNTGSTSSAAVNFKAGDLGVFSVAYAPNRGNSKTFSSDTIGTANTSSSLSGSFKGSLGIPGLTVGVGTMKDNNSVAANDDKESMTYGASYNFGKVAVGYQRIDNTLDTNAKTETIETEADQYGISFAASDTLSVGVYQIKQEKTTQGTANSPELKANLVSVGYNFGAAKLSYDFLDAENALNATGDLKIHKIKVGMAF